MLLFLLVLAALEWRAMPAVRANLIEEDGAYWASLAAALARGDWAHGLSTAWPPGYPAAIAVLAWIARAASTPAMLEGCARFVSVIAGTLLLIPLYRLARRLMPEIHARAVVALAAFHPRLTTYSASALSEMTFTLLLLVGLAALADAEGEPPGRHRRQGLAGLALGASYLVRPEGLLLAKGLWLVGLFRGPRSWVARLRPAFIVGLTVATIPWLLFLHARLGFWSLGEKGDYNFWRANRAEYAQVYSPPRFLSARVNDSPEVSDGLPAERVNVVGFAMKRPGSFLSHSLGRLLRIVFDTVPTTLYWPFAVVAVLGFLGTRTGPWWIVATPLALTPLLYAPFSTDRRFFVPLVPLLLIACGQALKWLDQRGARNVQRSPGTVEPPPRLGRVARFAAIGLLLTSIAWGGWLLRDQHPAREQRAIGEWLRHAWRDPAQRPALLGVPATSQDTPFPPASVGGSARPIVAGRKPWVAFYSGGLIAELPDSLPGTLPDLARRHGSAFLVADARSAFADRPNLQPLLDPALAGPGLVPVHAIEQPDRILLYRVAAGSSAR